MPSWKKVITSGSDAVLNSVTATTGFTGSLLGTASYATNALSASFATTASYVSSNFQYEIHVSQVDGNDTTGNGDLLKPVATIGKALLLVSASVASTDRRTIIVHPGTYIENITINTTNTYFFSTGVLGANCLISGSVTISAATRMSGIKMTNLIVSSSNPIYINNCAVDTQMTVSGSGYLEVQNTSLQCTSGIQVVGPASSGVIFENCSLYPLTVNNASAAVYVISCNQAITPTLTAGALTITRSTISSLTSGATSTALTTAAGSVLVLESCNVYNSLLTSHAAITANGFYSIKNVIYNRSASTLASLSGTGGPLATVSQFQYINADNINSTQGLSVTGSITVSGSVINNLTASYAISASQAVSASYATTASYALNGGVTQLLAGPNISLSPTNGTGQVTVSSTPSGGGFNTATGSYGSFYDTTIQTNVASTARSMSLNTTDITNGVSISGSTNPFNTYIKVANAGVYDIQFSAQVDKTDSGTDEIWIWIRKNGTDISDTATSVQLQGNGAHYVAAWNFFVNAAAGDYFQLMWYSPDANVRLHAESAFGIVPGIPSLIVTANRVDQFLSNTGSFSGSFTGSLLGTASYATQALSASYAPGGGNPFPYNGNAQISGSFGVTGSFVAITVDDVAFIRNLHDSQTGSGSLDFGNRDLLDSTGNGVFNWTGVAATIDARLYLNQAVSATTRNALITNVGYGGISLSEVLFDSGVQTNDLVYLNTDGKWYEVDQATDTSTKMLGICQGYNPMTYLGFVITEGDIIISTGPGYPLVQGANYGLPIYIRTSAGTQMSTTIPISGYVRVLGHVYHNAGGLEWIMKFRPSNDWYVI
jgi:hypothetical protein